MLRVFIIISVIFALNFSTALAQEAQTQVDLSQKIRPREYDIFVNLPEGFHLGYRKGSFPNYIEEYIPEGEEINAWSEMFTISFIGEAQGRNISTFGDSLESILGQICEESSVLFKDPKPEENMLEVGSLCIGSQQSKLPLPEGTVLRDVEIILQRYLVINDNIHSVQRAWHGSREEYDAIQDKEGQVNAWREDLDRFYICHYADIENLCDGVDMDDNSEAGAGKDYAALIILPENESTENVQTFLNTIIFGQDDTESYQAVVNTAKKGFLAHKSNMRGMFLIQYESLVEKDENGVATNRDYPNDRVKMASFLFLTMEALIAQDVPANRMGILFVNMHPF